MGAASLDSRIVTTNHRGTMEIRVAVIADAANMAGQGKLNILGIFDTLSSRKFPCMHPAMYLVLRCELDFAEAEKSHNLVVEVCDEDMRVLGTATAMVEAKTLPAGRTGCVQQILQFAGMQFTRPGSYRFRITWDGIEKAQIPLYVTLVE